MAGTARGETGQPYRAQIDVCFIADGEDGASEWWDRALEALEGLGVTFPQGGSSERMAPSDVIADSPLDRALRQRAV